MCPPLPPARPPLPPTCPPLPPARPRRAPPQVPKASAELDGRAVVVLCRSLCAVSREELEQGHPRLHCLQMLVECAWNNIGGCRCAWGNVSGRGWVGWGVASLHLANEWVCYTRRLT